MIDRSVVRVGGIARAEEDLPLEAAGGVVDPNVAPKEELAALPGMSDTIVDAILGSSLAVITLAIATVFCRAY